MTKLDGFGGGNLTSAEMSKRGGGYRKWEKKLSSNSSRRRQAERCRGKIIGEEWTAWWHLRTGGEWGSHTEGNASKRKARTKVSRKSTRNRVIIGLGTFGCQVLKIVHWMSEKEADLKKKYSGQCLGLGCKRDGCWEVAGDQSR